MAWQAPTRSSLTLLVCAFVPAGAAWAAETLVAGTRASGMGGSGEGAFVAEIVLLLLLGAAWAKCCSVMASRQPWAN
ncbi:hypothetical protein [Mesorhizobium sp. M0019]|uniref:hypothetical protein n=1 Tax=Mesorhizobium sp. M0019 TaxID=2956845 RepID=UPI003336D4F6